MTHSRPTASVWLGYAVATLAVVFWGASFVATRIALRSLTPFGLVAARLSIGVAVLVIVLRLRNARLLPVRRDWLLCALLGLVLFSHLAIQAFGLLHTTAINTGWIMGFIPVLIALAAHLLNRQRLIPIGWAGTLLATAGVMLVTSARLADFANARFGDWLQIISCFTWTAYTLAGSGVTARNGATRVTALVMAVAAALAWLLAAPMGLTHAAMTAASWTGLAFLGVLCSGAAFALWYQGLLACGPTRVGALLYLEPFVTSAVALALLAEPMTIRTVVGAGGVFLGVWMVGRGVTDRPGPPDPEPVRSIPTKASS